MKKKIKAERLVENLLRANDSLWDYGTKREARRVGMRTNQLLKYIKKLERRVKKYEQQTDL